VVTLAARRAVASGLVGLFTLRLALLSLRTLPFPLIQPSVAVAAGRATVPKELAVVAVYLAPAATLGPSSTSVGVLVVLSGEAAVAAALKGTAATEALTQPECLVVSALPCSELLAAVAAGLYSTAARVRIPSVICSLEGQARCVEAWGAASTRQAVTRPVQELGAVAAATARARLLVAAVTMAAVGEAERLRIVVSGKVATVVLEAAVAATLAAAVLVVAVVRLPLPDRLVEKESRALVAAVAD
jgi:hypothetical protein